MKTLIIIFFSLLTFTLNGQPGVIDKLVLESAENLLGNTVRIEVLFPDGNKSKGFGFITGEQNNLLYIATAAHTTNGPFFDINPSKIEVFFYQNDKSEEAKVLRFFEDVDLALLEIEKPQNFDFNKAFADLTNIERPKVRFIGRGNRWSIIDGGEVFDNIVGKLYFAPQSIIPGTSGAPLISKGGIVGMILNDSFEDAQALSIFKIRELFESLPSNRNYFSSQLIEDDLVLIPGGDFKMGDFLMEGKEHEKPLQKVLLSDFYLSPYEVTRAEIVAFLNAKGNIGADGLERVKLSGDIIEENGKFSLRAPADRDLPVQRINWHAAIAFCNWKSEVKGLQKVYTINGKDVIPNWEANGYRLPTEAEWEFAAREGGKHVRFGNGRDKANPTEINFAMVAYYERKFPHIEKGKDFRRILEVGSLKPNSLGLYHMSGNVREWCWDYFGPYNAENFLEHPKGVDSGKTRVLRGGDYRSRAGNVRNTERFSGYPLSFLGGVGFRVARNK